MEISNPKVLLTGRPGVGKTTVIMKVIEGFKGRAGGFYTEEMRKGNVREGFRIKTLDGRDGILAHINHSGPFRVGRYGVDVESFDEIAIPSLERALERDELIIIDEIGKMELCSEAFREAVAAAMDSDRAVVATVPIYGLAFVDELKRRPDVILIEITRSNRDALPARVMELLAEPAAPRA